MTKKIIALVTILIALQALPIHGLLQSPSHAQTPMSGISKPLVVIRFNQVNVYYEKQLYYALSKAVAIKPDVVFDVVSYMPANEEAQAQASRNTGKILQSMTQMGIPRERINAAAELDPSLRYDEVHIYVR